MCEVFESPYHALLQAAGVGGHSRARVFGLTHRISQLIEVVEQEGADWQDYLCMRWPLPLKHTA